VHALVAAVVSHLQVLSRHLTLNFHFSCIVLMSMGMNSTLAQPVSLRCVTTGTEAKEVMIVMLDVDRGEIKTESSSADQPHKRMIFQIEEMNDAVIEGRRLGHRDSFLEFNRKTAHIIEGEDEGEPTLYDCEAP
jgi:hypothetical protein